MDIHLNSHGEQLIQKHLRSGRYQSAEQVVVSALEALNQNEESVVPNGESRRAVQNMLDFAGKHGFTLGTELRIQDLIHEGHKY